jgi:hypothetical protein
MSIGTTLVLIGLIVIILSFTLTSITLADHRILNIQKLTSGFIYTISVELDDCKKES